MFVFIPLLLVILNANETFCGKLTQCVCGNLRDDDFSSPQFRGQGFYQFDKVETN